MSEVVKHMLRHCCSLFGRRNLYRISRFIMCVARGDVDNTSFELNGESLIQELSLRTAVSPATVFDVGANVGLWTANLLKIAADLDRPVFVHAFEPCRDTFMQLSQRLGAKQEVVIVNQACSNKVGTASMHVYGAGAGTNSLADPIDNRQFANEEVQVTTIDLYCKAKEIENIDLPKIDAEGYDFYVIAGASEMLKRHAIRILQFEYNHRWIGSRSYLRDVFALLVPNGYSIGKLIGQRVEFYSHWQWELESCTEANYIAYLKNEERQFHHSEPTWLRFDSDTSPALRA
jgi:FkbM family methyltransferase